MKAVIQRCKHALVTADDSPAGEIKQGLLVLLGVAADDTAQDAEILAQKISNLRIFCDENDKLNLSVLQIGGKVLCVSNFTLCADVKKGNRPAFTGAMAPKPANQLYKLFCSKLKACGVWVETGVFGADMQIDLCCDGPITLVYDTKIWRR